MTRGWPTTALLFVATHPLGTLLVLLAVGLGTRFGWDGLLPPAVGLLGQLCLSMFDGAAGAPGKVLTPAAQPHVTALVKRVADQVGFTEPLLVSLVPFPDAGLARTRVHGARVVSMMLGLPFLRLMTEAQLASVIAHELGHLRDLDDKRTARLLWARDALAARVAAGAVLPRLLGGWLLRRTQSLSFVRELAADADAARVAGTAATAAALRDTHVQYEVFNNLVAGWFEVLEGSYPVDAYEAFEVATADPWVRARAAEDSDAVEPWDSHPPIPERVAALPSCEGSAFADQPVELHDVEELRRWCVAELADTEERTPVRVLDDPRVVLPTKAREAMGVDPSQLVGWIVDGTWAAHVGEDEGVLLGQLLSIELIARGWTQVSPWLMSRVRSPEGVEVELRDVVRSALADPAEAGELVRLAAEAGLS